MALATALLGSCSDDESKPDDKAENDPEISDTNSGFSAGAAGFPGLGLGTGSGDGIQVIATGTAVVPADAAQVVLVPESAEEIVFEGVPGEPFDREAILTSLDGVGVPDTSVHIVDPAPSFGVGGEIAVDVEVDSLPARGEEIAEAVDEAIDLGTEGVRFKVGDCTAAVPDAQADALERARAEAEALAPAAGLEVGALVSAVETPSDPYSELGSADPCKPDDSGALSSLPFAEFSAVQPFDTDAEVELQYGVIATFAIAGASKPESDGRFTTTGTGSVTADADEAYVEVYPEPSFSDSFESDVVDVDEAEVEAAVADLGIAPEDVEVSDASDTFYAYGSRIRIEVAVDQLPEIGDQIVEVLDDEMDLSGTNGVVFTSSACESLLTEARTVAVDDAEARLTNLAEVAQQELGELVGIAPADAGSLIGLPSDPCPEEEEGDDALEGEADDSSASPSDSGAIVESITTFAEDPYAAPPLEPFAAPPRFTIEAAVSVTRAGAAG